MKPDLSGPGSNVPAAGAWDSRVPASAAVRLLVQQRWSAHLRKPNFWTSGMLPDQCVDRFVT
jgi:hypothetical protein